MPFKKGETPKGAKPFKKGESGNPKGYAKGVPNRSTVFKRFLDLAVEVADPKADAESGKTIKVSLYEAAALGQLVSAKLGNTPAWKEIQDTLHGKQSNVNLNLSTEELKNLTDAELDDLITRLSR